MNPMTKLTQQKPVRDFRHAAHAMLEKSTQKPKLWSQRLVQAVITIGLSALLPACASTMDRLSQVGQPPAMTQIQNPKLEPGYREVTMPMPASTRQIQQANSLWKSGRKSFFKDQRASRIGDILTVMINIEDEASMESTLERSRSNNDDFDMNGLFGLQTQLDQVIPDGVLPTDLVNLNSTGGTSGDGTIEREEEIELKIAAMITQLLPNGNMVIHGKQEVRVNHEVRELQLSGIIRPEDITPMNQITHEKIAEARIAYGGRGLISDMQKPRVGAEILDILMPY